MTPALHPDTFPRWPLLLIGAVLACTLVWVTAVRLSGTEITEPDAATVASRLLRFADQSDGGIAVIDAGDGRTVAQIHGEAGFVRGTLRALARERHMRGIGPQPPFELLARADGRLTLHDPATGQRVDLESFGPTNAGNFRRLLTVGADGAQAAATLR
jgi:putative photosynthetic complex assembly protein